jgi:ankyrin repeat protein
MPAGALHLMAKRGDVRGVVWLIEHGADPNGRWTMWDDEVLPLHFAAHDGNADVVRALLDAGADPSLRDAKYNGDAIGWAEHGNHPEIAELIRSLADQRS